MAEITAMYLTREQLAQLTGMKSSRGQIDWLVQNDWKFAVGQDGRPRVAEAEHLRKMVSGYSVPRSDGGWQPDRAALAAVVGGR